jgi:hypothetical protein
MGRTFPEFLNGFMDLILRSPPQAGVSKDGFEFCLAKSCLAAILRDAANRPLLRMRSSRRGRGSSG